MRPAPSADAAHVVPLIRRHVHLDDLDRAVPASEHDGETARVPLCHFTDGGKDVDQVVPPRVDPALHGGRIARREREQRLLDPVEGQVDAPVAGDAEHVDPLLRSHDDVHRSASATVLRDQHPEAPGRCLGGRGPSVQVPDEAAQYLAWSTPQA